MEHINNSPHKSTINIDGLTIKVIPVSTETISSKNILEQSTYKHWNIRIKQLFQVIYDNLLYAILADCGKIKPFQWILFSDNYQPWNIHVTQITGDPRRMEKHCELLLQAELLKSVIHVDCPVKISPTFVAKHWANGKKDGYRVRIHTQ